MFGLTQREKEEHAKYVAEYKEEIEQEKQKQEAEWTEMRAKIKEPDIDSILKRDFQTELGKTCQDVIFLLRAMGVDDTSIKHYIFAKFDMIRTHDRASYSIHLKEYFGKLFQCGNP